MMNNREWDRILLNSSSHPARMTRTEKLDLSAFSVQSAANLQNSIIILFMSQALLTYLKC